MDIRGDFMTIIKMILFAAIVAVAVIFFTLYKNGANLSQPPGLGERLQVFLTTNYAKTEDDHKFKELQTPQFNMSAEKLYQRVLKSAADLGWEILAHDSDNQNANFVVRSPVFLFEDNLYVQVEFLGPEKSSLHVESASRVGSVDFAANSGHIQALINRL